MTGVAIIVNGSMVYNITNGKKVEEITCSEFWKGRYVMLNSTIDYYLTVCEVEVWACSGDCEEGFTGLCCTECSADYYFNGITCTKCGHCISGTTCNNVTGTCTSCQTGWKGPNCIECIDGYYDNCTKQCGNCSGGHCHNETGHCLHGCSPGWQGIFCKNECADGYYGNCSTPCGNCSTEHCGKEDGYCPHGCIHGWQGNTCDKQCENGFYGNCSTPCGNCSIGTCHKENGLCSSGCMPGWKGDICKEQCEDGYYGDCSTPCGNCSDSMCHKDNGFCPRGCMPGWQGDKCEEQCEDGYYGNCSTPCGKCLLNETCHKENGHCPSGCMPGWQENKCKEQCEDGYYGNCSTQCGKCSTEQCHKENGFCPSGCMPGWQGEKCEEQCEDGYYGNCSTPCGNCSTEQCHKESGFCPNGCMPGWQGNTCSEQCNDGYYDNCSTPCGNCSTGFCHKVDGRCPYGCSNGWQGDTCKEQIAELNGQGSNVAGTVAGVVAGILIAILAVVIVLWIRHRRFNQKTEERPQDCTERSDSTPFKEMMHEGIKPKTYVEPRTQHETGVKGNRDDHVYNNASDFALENSVNRTTHLYENTTGSSSSLDVSQSKNIQASEGVNSQDANNIIYQNALVTLKSERPVVPEKRVIDRKSHKETKTAYEENDNDGDDDNNVYCNEDIYSCFTQNIAAHLDVFQRSLLINLSSGQLSQKFKKLPKGMKHPHEEGMKPINVKKNRFKALCPYDSNRIILKWRKGKTESDYINASYIKGCQREKAYIAAQGPRLNTMNDMWWMVWQEGVTQIVMLTNLKEEGKDKCEEYWPASGSTQMYGDVSVTGLNIEHRADFVIRTFSLKVKGNELLPRAIQHYHYTAWPDHGVPTATSLVDYWRYVRAHSAPLAPVLVHCSAGVGRTGTYIALDIAMETSARHADVNVHKIVSDLREDRTTMVQTEAQYKFLYEVILEAHTSRGTRLSFEQFDIMFPKLLNIHQPNDITDKEFEMLQQMGKFVPKSHHFMATSDENKGKNRNQDALPDDSYLAYLGVHMAGRNMYINAVFAPSFRHRRGILLTQLPFPDTLVDIWRLVDDKNVNTIVSLGSKDEQITVNNFCQYWPKKTEDVISTGSYTIQHIGSYVISDHITSFRLSLKKDKFTHDIRLLHFTDWTGEVPESTKDVLHLAEILSTKHFEKNSSPVIIQCIDGAARSSLLCILLEIIERAKCDQETDIYLTARHMQAIRPQAITTEVQYRFCYKVVQDFQRQLGIYQNA